ITVDLGETFTLDLVLSSAVNGMSWYFNGAVLANGTTSYTSPPATLAMAGEYYWRGFVPNSCGYLYSDTITVTVLLPTGVDTRSEDVSLRVHPNPSSGLFYVQLPGTLGKATLMVTDAL